MAALWLVEAIIRQQDGYTCLFVCFLGWGAGIRSFTDSSIKQTPRKDLEYGLGLSAARKFYFLFGHWCYIRLSKLDFTKKISFWPSLAIFQNLYLKSHFFSKKTEKCHISKNRPKIKKIRPLYFFELLKLERRKCQRIRDFWLIFHFQFKIHIYFPNRKSTTFPKNYISIFYFWDFFSSLDTQCT